MANRLSTVLKYFLGMVRSLQDQGILALIILTEGTEDLSSVTKLSLRHESKISRVEFDLFTTQTSATNMIQILDR